MPEKYKDEIEEILKRAGEAATSDTHKEAEHPPEDKATLLRISRPARSSDLGNVSRWPSLTPGKIALAGVIVFLVGLRFFPLIWVGLGMLVVAYLLYFVTPRSASQEKRWSGRVVEERRTAWQRVKRWLRS